MWPFIVYFSINVVLGLSFEYEPIVELSNGKIRGCFRENHYSFESIPYAEAPVGENRFEPPKPFTNKWNGIRNATLISSPCIQWIDPATSAVQLAGEEDCLYINVYTPDLYGGSQYPVIFYIHGGGFMSGSGGVMSADLLLKEKKFVYVNFNYRLGPMGFAGTEDNQIAGNMGLKDQALALEWVKDNIRTFNGDPNKIIMIGHSAGGASVHFHLLSGKVENSVKAAISHSGTAHCSWAMVRNPLQRTKKLAANVNCSTDSTEEMKKCLKKADAKDIVTSVQVLQPYMYNPFTVFGPTIEPKSSSQPFLTEEPDNLIKSGNISKVPWLVSYVPDEGVYNAAIMMKKNENGVEIIEDLNEIWSAVAPHMLFTQDNSLISKLTQDYMGDNRFSAETYQKFQNMFTDHLFLDGIEKSIRLHKDYTNQSVYVSVLNCPSYSGIGNFLSNRYDISFGTSHGDDVFFFGGREILAILPLTEDREAIAKYLFNMYESLLTEGTHILETIRDYNSTTLQKNIPNSRQILELRITPSMDTLESVNYISRRNKDN